MQWPGCQQGARMICLSLLEGAMYGKPLISCEIGTGTSYININGETGFILSGDNCYRFVEAFVGRCGICDCLWRGVDGYEWKPHSSPWRRVFEGKYSYYVHLIPGNLLISNGIGWKHVLLVWRRQGFQHYSVSRCLLLHCKNENMLQFITKF